ncbi:hypothetical protein FEP90_05478 [Burkholderia multivorans]|nr:hypothetical protein [Burkholderia multivorans]
MRGHLRHAERVGNAARMLAARAAERRQHIARHVVAALHRNLLDRVRHAADRNLEEAFRECLGRLAPAGRRMDLVGERAELRDHAVAIERLVGMRAEHAREIVGLDLAEHHVAVGHGQRAAAPVCGRPRIRAGRFGTDPQPRAVEAQHRAAARRDRMDAHHRRAHPHAGHLRLEHALELAVVVRHVSRRAAHVEADHALEAGRARRAHHADDAARRARQDRVLALERIGARETAAALHELQVHARHLVRDLFDVAAQDRRQIRVDDRRVAARHHLHQRRHLVRRRHLREADAPRELRERAFVRGVAIAVDQHDRERAHAVVEHAAQRRLGAGEIERRHDLAVRADAFVDLDDGLVQRIGQHDVEIEQPRPVLVRDAQHVAKAARRRERRAFALALEQRVGRDGRAHLHHVDAFGRDRFAVGEAEQMADAGHGRVAILLGVLRQQLVRDERAVGPARDDVGERAAAVDPELPARGVGGNGESLSVSHGDELDASLNRRTSAAARRASRAV